MVISERLLLAGSSRWREAASGHMRSVCLLNNSFPFSMGHQWIVVNAICTPLLYVYAPLYSFIEFQPEEYRNRPLRNKAFGVVGTDAVWVGIA
jgi:hypothetical protein